VTQRGKVDQPFVEILDLGAVLPDLVDHLRKRARLTVHLRGCLGELGGWDAAPVASNPSFELLLALERFAVRSPMLDHALDERPDLDEGVVRFLRSEVAHSCNPMRRMSATEAPLTSRTRLAYWTALVAAIAGLNYYARFSSSSSSTSVGRDEVYSWSAFAGGLVVYVVWLGLVLAIAANRTDLLALRRPRSWGRALRLGIGAVVFVYVFEIFVSVLPLPQSPSAEQGLTPTHWEPAHAAAFAANVALFTIVAPIVEELMFRGVGQSLLRYFGRVPAILLVGVTFGLTHGLLEALVVLIPFGVALAYLRDRTDSVYPGMLVHASFNAVALAYAVLG
jgi:membrane protease YdiL (CAAX protease family)